MTNLVGFLEPYHYQPNSFFGWYDIMFEEDTMIFNIRGEEVANQVVAAMNGAYNLGRSHEIINQEMNDGSPTT